MLQPIPDPALGSPAGGNTNREQPLTPLPAGDRPETKAAAPPLPSQIPRTPETPPAALQPGPHRPTPPEMMAEALAPPPGSRLTGRPLTVLTAISSRPDRRAQLEVAHGYWRLVKAVAGYHTCLDHADYLRRLQVDKEQAVLLEAARASAAASLEEAEAAAVAAQHELATLVLLPPDGPPPLPADAPHVGGYRTRFDELFAGRTAPARAVIIDHTLPIRCRAIDARAAAVQAAETALCETVDAHRFGRAGLTDVLSCSEQCLRQRQAFIGSVCDYNQAITDYVFMVAGPGATARDLVGMLIEPAATAVRPPASDDGGGVTAAGLQSPVPTPARRP